MLHCFSQGLKILKRRGSNKVKKKLPKTLIIEHWMYYIDWTIYTFNRLYNMSIFKLLFLFSLKSNYIVYMAKYFMNFAFKCHTCQKTANRNFFLLNWPPSGFLKFQAKKRSPQPTQEEQLRNQKNWVNTVISLFKMGPQNVFQAISPCKFLAFGQLSYGLPLLL